MGLKPSALEFLVPSKGLQAFEMLKLQLIETTLILHRLAF